MKLSIFLILSFLVLPLSTYARLSDADKQQLPELSIIDNGGFENGTAKWTNAGGTFSLETTSPAQGKASGIFTGASSGNTLCSDLKLQEAIFDGNAGEVSFSTKGGTADAYKAYVKNGNGIKVSQDVVIPVNTDYLISSVFFAFANSSKTANERTLQLCIEHVAGSASSNLYIDNVFFGKLRGLSSTDTTTLAKGSLITSDGTANGEFTACADNQPLVFDSTEDSGLRCSGSVTDTSAVYTLQDVYSNGFYAGYALHLNKDSTYPRDMYINMYKDGDSTVTGYINQTSDGSLHIANKSNAEVKILTNNIIRFRVQDDGGTTIETAGGLGGNIPHNCRLLSAAGSTGTSSSLSCAAGEFAMGGGCDTSNVALTALYHGSTTTITCESASSTSFYHKMICCDY